MGVFQAESLSPCCRSLAGSLSSTAGEQLQQSGGFALVISAGILFYFVKQHRPEYYGLLPDGAIQTENIQANQENLISGGNKNTTSVQEVEFTFKQTTKTPSYWMIVAGWGVITIIVSGVSLHLIPFLTDTGINPIVAASMLSIMIFFILPARILGSLLSDHIKKNSA